MSASSQKVVLVRGAARHRARAFNLTGAFLCTKVAVPLMGERGGAVVNIPSISAVRASTLRSA